MFFTKNHFQSRFILIGPIFLKFPYTYKKKAFALCRQTRRPSSSSTFSHSLIRSHTHTHIDNYAYVRRPCFSNNNNSKRPSISRTITTRKANNKNKQTNNKEHTNEKEIPHFFPRLNQYNLLEDDEGSGGIL